MTASTLIPKVFGAVALVAFSSYASAACNGGYRWSEVKGGKTVTHYTQQPPEGRASECVQISTGTRTQVNAGDAENEVEDGERPATPGGNKSSAGAQQPATAPGKSKGLEALPEKDPDKCKQAQDTKSVLDSHARIREKGENGEYRYLTPDEIAEQKRLADESTGIYCE